MVVVVGVAASGMAFVASTASVHDDTRLLLRQDAVQGSLVVGSLYGQAPQAAVDLAALAGPGEVPAARWRSQAARVAGEDRYSALALLRDAGSHFQLVAGVGTPHRTFGDGTNAAALAALRAGRSLAWEVSSQPGRRWLAEFVGAPAVSAGSAIYIERALPTGPFSLATLPGHPFSGVRAAIYAGSEAPGHLVLATTRRVPFVGLQATTEIATGTFFGVRPVTLGTRSASISAAGRLVLVVEPMGSLVGSAAAAFPWVLLGGGIAASAVVAGLLQLADRRRRKAEALAGALTERNAALDVAIANQKRVDARFAAMVRSSSDLTTVTDAAGVINYQSPASVGLLGADPSSLVGTPMAALVHPDDREHWRQTMDGVGRAAGTEAVAEWRLRTASGGHVTVESRITNLLDDRAVDGILFNSRDVSDRRHLESELRQQAFHDSLTGLANRALFADRVEHAAARLGRTDGGLGVLLIDLDNFKAVNDGRGHSVGDELLMAVADRLRSTVRAGETAARLGGDEFAVLVETGDPSGAAGTADRLLTSLRTPFAVTGGPVDVRVSIGVATTTDPRATAEHLLRDADIAMYAAKGRGKNRVEVFRRHLHDEIIDRLELENDLARSVANDELLVNYQTIVDIATGMPTGVEALMRWNQPRRGLVMPTTFIPIAERTGLIVPIGRWLLRRACEDACLLQVRAGRSDIHLAVNVSTRQFDDPAFVDDVASALDRSGLDPHLLTLEVTESVFMADAEHCSAVLRQLKRLGLRLSIDDFGTGFSSLSYLQMLPFDELKIDRSFVVAGDGDGPPPLVSSIVRMADDLGLSTVAEGVETDLQLRHMRAAGCTSAQGFLFSRPSGIGRLLRHESLAHRPALPPHR